MAETGSLEYKKVEEKVGKNFTDKNLPKLTLEEKQEVLKQAQNDSITKDALKDLIKDFLRTKNRKAQFDELSKNGNEKQKNLLKGKNIDSISAHDLLVAENEGSGFLSKAFAYKQIKDESGEIIETPFDGKDIKEKDIIKIDFGKNRNANYKIGAGDMLPSSVKVVKIKDEKGNERVGVRSIGKKSNGSEKVGYYDKNGYIPVFNNYTIEIPTKEEVEKITKDLSKDVEISNDENKEKEAKNKYLETVAKEEEREEKIRAFTIEANKPFMENAKALAMQIEKVYGIPWQVIAGQASLESRWGTSGLATKDNNIFGVKASKSWTGAVSAWDTTEYNQNGSAYRIKADFRSYADIKESFIDHAKFLIQNPRYRLAFRYAQDLNPRPDYYPSDYIGYNPEKFVEEIGQEKIVDGVKRGGYATNPKYATDVIDTWHKYDALETKAA